MRPDLTSLQGELHGALERAGYEGATARMLEDWLFEDVVDVYSFSELARKRLPVLWEEVRRGFLDVLLSEEEIDYLQQVSRVRFICQDGLWEDWPYYGGYRGGYLSMISLNARLFWNPYQLKALLVREVLPGRHLFWLLRQRLYDTRQLPSSAMLALVAGPERVVQEGIGGSAWEFVWSRGGHDPREEVAFAWRRLWEAAGAAAAYKLYQNGEPWEEVVSFIEEAAFLPPGRARALAAQVRERAYYYPAVYIGSVLIGGLWDDYGADFWPAITGCHTCRSLSALYPGRRGKEAGACAR